jgi:hypothetical protein
VHDHQQQQLQQDEVGDQQPFNTHYNYIRIFECMPCASAAAALNGSSSSNNNDEISFGILLLSDAGARLFLDAIAGSAGARCRVQGLKVVIWGFRHKTAFSNFSSAAGPAETASQAEAQAP